MGKKYSINSNGLIVAERDIYSLGGFIPKGKTGGKIANENQLSQDGECWFHTGDLSGTPNVVLRDNAYLLQFTALNNNNGHFILSGNTEMNFNFGTIVDYNVGGNPLYIHNSKINAVFASRTIGNLTTDYQIEQGSIDITKPAGTPISNMKVALNNACRGMFVSFINEKSRIMAIPPNISLRAIYTYIGLYGTDLYSGETKYTMGGSLDLYHPVYKRCFLTIWDNKDMTPVQCKELGIIFENQIAVRTINFANKCLFKDSSITDSNIYFNETTESQSLVCAVAGGFNGCKDVVVTEGTSTDRNLMGTFSNVEKLIIAPKSITTNDVVAGNNLFIRAYDCPLLHVDNTTYSGIPLTEKDGLVLRNCIVPKAQFINNPIEGNTYEGIDFSYAQKDLGQHGNYIFKSSHFQGMYDLYVNSYPYARLARVSGTFNFEVNTTVLRPMRMNNINGISGYDYTSIPHIEGSSYVVGGTSVYGDVKMVGSEYKYLVMGENMFERGSIDNVRGLLPEDLLIPSLPGSPRIRGTALIPVKAGDRIVCADGYYIYPVQFDINGRSLGIGEWVQGMNIVNDSTRYIWMLLKKGSASTVPGDYISELDIPLAKVSIQYAYKKKYYVTNVSDIPSDGMGGRDENYKLLGPSDWEQGDVSNAEVNYGKTYDQIKSIATNPNYVRTKGLFNIPSTPSLSEKPITGFVRTKVLFDALERYEPNNAINAFMSLVLRKDPQEPITPSDVYNAHLVIEYVPTPRIIASYQGNTFTVEGKVRMYDNSVLYGNITNDSNHAIELHGDAVIGDNLTCVCGWGDE